MTSKNIPTIQTIGVVGAGTMGAGIAQLFAGAGYHVLLFDSDKSRLDAAVQQVLQRFERLREKGQLSSEQLQLATQRLSTAESIETFANTDLVIEAIVEDRSVKCSLFRQLEKTLSDECIVVTNTSSLSVTDIASTCDRPDRVAGLHFFNPVPLMKLVEVIAAEQTASHITDALIALVQSVGHHAVAVKDTPGFLVNHLGRAFSTEGLKMLQEQISSAAVLDQIVRQAGGFRMGPFELLDLTGLDVSVPVMEQVYAGFYQEPRIRPVELGRRRLASGKLGRKTGMGFYDYSADASNQNIESCDTEFTSVSTVRLCAKDWQLEAMRTFVRSIGLSESKNAELILVAPMGTDVSTECDQYDLDAMSVVGIDVMFGLDNHVTLMTNPLTSPALAERLQKTIIASELSASIVRDSAGCVMQRLVGLMINLGCDIAQQGIADPSEIDRAVKLALGYPHGPLAWGDQIGAKKVLAMMKSLQKTTGDDRYRPSPWLRQRALVGASLLQTNNQLI